MSSGNLFVFIPIYEDQALQFLCFSFLKTKARSRVKLNFLDRLIRFWDLQVRGQGQKCLTF